MKNKSHQEGGRLVSHQGDEGQITRRRPED
jgi:hypothetical protein